MARDVHLPVPKAFLFDWDDTLVDSWHIVHAAVNATLTAFGHAVWTEAEARVRLGPPARVLFTELFGASRWQEADALYIAAYQKAIHNHLHPFPLADKLLQTVARTGIYCAVVSAKRGDILRQEAKHLGFDSYFSRLVGAGDAVKDKPHAESALHALEGSGLSLGADVWLLGDSLTDMQLAHNAGMTGLLLETKPPPESTLTPFPPTHRFKNHEAVVEYVERMFVKYSYFI